MMRINVSDALVAKGKPPMDFLNRPQATHRYEHELSCARRLAVGASPRPVEAQLTASGKGHRKVLSKEVHCRSLSSIHILYNHDPVQALYSLPGRCAAFDNFNCPEVQL
eukprot:6819587-Prymnesium_polylepis.2